MVKLNKIKTGQKAKICGFECKDTEMRSCIFGIECNQEITCIARSGAIVIRKNSQEIAIGENLSNKIYIQVI